MKKIFFFLSLVLLMFIGCDEQPKNDIFKTTDGEYASRMGKFVAQYPSKPFHHIYRKKLPENEDQYYEIHSIRSTFGDKRIFNVEYIDLKDEFF